MSTLRRPDEIRIEIVTDGDIVRARQAGRELAASAGCASTDQTMVATAISEIARNLLTHAGGGDLEIRLVDRRGRTSLEIVARDDGPGIADLERALEDGFTTGDGLGLGLPGARRLMDEFIVESEVGRGTVVTMHKWCGS